MKRGRRSILPATLFLLAFMLGTLYLLAAVPLRQARTAWLAGRGDQAIAVLERWRGYHLRPRDFDEGLAAAYLTRGDLVRGREALARLARRGPTWRAPLPKLEVAQRLIGAGAYEIFLEFDRTVHEREESPDVALYRATALAGTGHNDEAQRQFARLDRSKVDARRYERLKSVLQSIHSGSLTLLFDRTGHPLGAYHFSDRTLRAVDPSFAPLIELAGGPHTLAAGMARERGGSVLHTTFDPEIQRAALDALGTARGSLVAIDTASGEIVAMASNHPDGVNLAIDRQYEPGSVIKVLTTLNSIDSGVSLSEVFPLDCKGYLDVDGKPFADWARHDRLESVDEAMATSCNVAFALLGFRLGAPRIDAFLQRARFSGQVDLGYCSAPLGKIHDPLAGRMTIANSSVGLGHESINTLHLAMLADAVANGGTLRTPLLIRGRETILGDPVVVAGAEGENAVRLASPQAIQQVVAAMKAVVSDPRGTGRRAAVDGLTIAMKTGTAGNRPYNALILAFAPAEHPRLAIGMIAEGAGPAEFEGARIAHDFFSDPRLKLHD